MIRVVALSVAVWWFHSLAKYISLLAAGALFLTSQLACPEIAAAATDLRPNILLIVSDDHGYGDVGAYGCRDIPTPHLDAIAAGGIRFTSGYVSGPYCSPTRAGLLTGRYQQRFGHEFNPGPGDPVGGSFGLPLSETTLPQRLRDAGYVTGMVGKWHLGDDEAHHPLNRGFDEFFGFLGGAHPYLRSLPGNPIMRGFEPVSERKYLTDAFRREALDFIDRHAAEPWFLYLSFNAVHGPMDAAERYLERFAHLEGKRQTYATMLTALDDAVGAVMEKLREHQLEENTLVLFLSDNGGPEQVNASDNGPFRGVKAQTFEGGIRVPFMIQWKGVLPAGQTYDNPVIQLDLVPTALAAAGAPLDGEVEFDGVNLLPFLKGENAGQPHSELFWRLGAQMAVRQGDWKLLIAPGAGLQDGGTAIPDQAIHDLLGAHLFNLTEDQGETTNLADAHPEKVRELATTWNRWNEKNIAPLWTSRRPGQKMNRRRRAQTAAPQGASPRASE